MTAENPAAALTLADKIEAELAKLATDPYLGKIPQDTHLAQLGYRVLVVGDYLLFYKIKSRRSWFAADSTAPMTYRDCWRMRSPH